MNSLLHSWKFYNFFGLSRHQTCSAKLEDVFGRWIQCKRTFPKRAICVGSFKMHEVIETVLSDASKKRFSQSLGTVKPASGIKLRHHRNGAVLVPLCLVDGKPSVLFTVRSQVIMRHRGEVSFPGGKMDENDTDLVQTALREAHEEVGICPEAVDVWGTMPPLTNRGGLQVTAVVGNIGSIDIDRVNFNKTEVELVFSRTIASLCSLDNIKSTQFRNSKSYTIPVFLGEHRIWGLTAVMLHLVLQKLVPEEYRFKLIHQPT